MKILLTGANGQLGQELVHMLMNTSIQFVSYTKSELDICNLEAVLQAVLKEKPDVIINSAAYTKVDLAESNEELAFAVNAYGQRNLAVAAEKVGAKVCYISTDYVFDGQANEPYEEFAAAAPIGVYGKSKYVGEQYTQSLSTKYFVVRTAWVYGQYGPNFVKTMLRLGAERDELSVVNDQIGAPTFTKDLAQFILQLVATEKYGIYHFTNSGQCSWYEFAQEIFKQAKLSVNVIPVSTEQYPTVAKRPSYSVLSHQALKINQFEQPRQWREALQDFLNNQEKS